MRNSGRRLAEVVGVAAGGRASGGHHRRARRHRRAGSASPGRRALVQGLQGRGQDSVPRDHLRLPQRAGRPRHPQRPATGPTATSSPSTSGSSTGGTTPTVPSRWRSERSRMRCRLLDVTEQSLYEGIALASPGNRIGDIGHAIQSFVEPHGFGIVREYVGHGIGRRLHEAPSVPNYGKPRRGQLLKARDVHRHRAHDHPGFTSHEGPSVG